MARSGASVPPASTITPTTTVAEKGEINHYYGGRGVYFDTPDGNLFEIITQPYGAVPESLGGRDAAQAR